MYDFASFLSCMVAMLLVLLLTGLTTPEHEAVNPLSKLSEEQDDSGHLDDGDAKDPRHRSTSLLCLI